MTLSVVLPINIFNHLSNFSISRITLENHIIHLINLEKKITRCLEFSKKNKNK